MPRGPSKNSYADGKIYSLAAIGTTDVYYGSTCASLETRLYQHNYAVSHPETTKQTSACKLYSGGRTVVIDLVEFYPCTSQAELNARERYWIENDPHAINKNIPCQTWKERAAKRDTEIKEYMAMYRALDYECDCGCKIRISEKARHQRSSKHIKLLADKNNVPSVKDE